MTEFLVMINIITCNNSEYCDNFVFEHFLRNMCRSMHSSFFLKMLRNYWWDKMTENRDLKFDKLNNIKKITFVGSLCRTVILWWVKENIYFECRYIWKCSLKDCKSLNNYYTHVCQEIDSRIVQSLLCERQLDSIMRCDR